MKRLTENINGEIMIPKKNIINGNLKPFFDKLGRLEDIEEKMKCPLDIYYKMCIEGTELYYARHNDIKQDFHKYIYYVDFNNRVCFCLYINTRLSPLYYLDEYGKTWALTKEELENNETNIK